MLYKLALCYFMAYICTDLRTQMYIKKWQKAKNTNISTGKLKT